VGVERLQNISPKDAIPEGIPRRSRSGAYRWPVNAFKDYSRLWDSINAKRAPWSSNPWVRVVEFKRV